MSAENLSSLTFQLQQTRNELHNIRKQFNASKAQVKEEVESLKKYVELQTKERSGNPSQITLQETLSFPTEVIAQYPMQALGHIKSCYSHKNGTHRQGCITALSRGCLSIDKKVFNNPKHSLEGLELYSHVWIFFIFHENIGQAKHAKVAPPRLNGMKVGVFATRSPHRPNSLGLTLAHLDKIEGSTLYLSGIDMLDGTPVVDIKPYIPQYDSPLIDKFQELDIQNSNTESNCLPLKSTTVLETKNRPSKTRSNETEGLDVEIGNIYFSEQKPFQNEPICYPIPGKSDHKMMNPVLADNIRIENNVAHVEDRSANTEADNTLHDFKNQPEQELENEKNCDDPKCSSSRISAKSHSAVATASWLDQPPTSKLTVIFHPRAEIQVHQFSPTSSEEDFRTEFLRSSEELREAISAILREDPRSSYRRQKCSDRLYYFNVDCAHVTAWFCNNEAEVLKVVPVSKGQHL